MAKTIAKEDLILNDKIKFDNKGGSILGILEGPIADFKHPTRNGRHYGEQLWEKVLKSDLVKEQFHNGGILGELDHPKDRDDICTEKVAICMPEPPVKKEDGKYYGKFNILDTPCGRIVYTLAKSGFKLGVSSRGNGDYDEYTGEVDPDSYDFTCFDVVVLPAVKDARMNLVTEGLGERTAMQKFKSLLTEQLKKETDENKKLINETVTHLFKTKKEWEDIVNGEVKENLDNPQEQAEFKKSNPNFVKSFDFNKYGKYFDKDGKLVDEQGYMKALGELGEQGKPIQEALAHHKCIICGNEFDGYGNNAEPVAHGICCDKCNQEKVIPARLKRNTLKEGSKYIGNARIVSKLPKVGDQWGYRDYYVIKIDKKETKDGYTIYDVVAQEKDSRDRKLGDNIDVTHGLVALKEDLEIPNVSVEDNTLAVDIDDTPEVEKSEGEEEPCEECKEFDDKLKSFLDAFLETQELEAEGEEEKDLFVKLFHETFPELDCCTEKCDNIDDEVEKENSEDPAANDAGAQEDELLEQLQATLKDNKLLKEKLRTLQASKAVGDSKVTKLTEELEQYKLIAANAGKKALKIKSFESENVKLNDKIKSLNESISKITKESVTQKSLKENIQNSLNDKTKENVELKEKLNNITTTSKKLEEKYQKSIKLVEQYKKFAHEIANRYIDSKALALGVSSNEIKNRLNESYTLDDVDKVCEELQQLSLNASKLPFFVDKPDSMRARLREDRSRDPLRYIDSQYDDSVDDYLLDLAGLKKN